MFGRRVGSIAGVIRSPVKVSGKLSYQYPQPACVFPVLAIQSSAFSSVPCLAEREALCTNQFTEILEYARELSTVACPHTGGKRAYRYTGKQVYRLQIQIVREEAHRTHRYTMHNCASIWFVTVYCYYGTYYYSTK